MDTARENAFGSRCSTLATMKVAQLTEAQFADPGYSIIRVPGPEPSPFLADSPFYITPIRIAEGRKPTVEGLQLSTGITTFVHKKRKVMIEPGLDILFVLTPEGESSFGGVKS